MVVISIPSPARIQHLIGKSDVIFPVGIVCISGIAENSCIDPERHFLGRDFFNARKFNLKTNQPPGKCGFQIATSHPVDYIVFISLQVNIVITQQPLTNVWLREWKFNCSICIKTEK